MIFGPIYIILLIPQWEAIIKWFKGLDEYSSERAQDQRKRFFTKDLGKDILELYYTTLDLYKRVGHNHFHATGVLLPLRASTREYTKANPYVLKDRKERTLH